jgi:hypothetical protein
VDGQDFKYRGCLVGRANSTSFFHAAPDKSLRRPGADIQSRDRTGVGRTTCAAWPPPLEEADALKDLLKALESGSDAATAWQRGREELKDLIARKTHTAVAEHQRLRDLSCVLTAEQAGAFVGALIASARETVMPVSEGAYRQLMERTCQLLPDRPLHVQAQEGAG